MTSTHATPTSPFIVGIDLGTTNSLIGVYDYGFPTLFANKEGSRLTPSVVSYLQESSPYVGSIAERQGLLYPEKRIASIKRLMGRRIGDPECKGWNNLVGMCGDPIKIRVGEILVTPEEVSSEILKELKTLAQERLGIAVTRSVITVPAYFNDAQRQATRRAGELAGWSVERIISEPTAAALAYGLDKLADQSKVAVYDFGGGTFDLSILKLDHGLFEVLSTCGDTNLGGDTIDQALVDFLLDQLQCKNILDLQMLARLHQAIRKAKEELSFNEETMIRLPFVDGSRSEEITLTRIELEKIALPIIERTRSLCLRAVADAKLQVEDLDEVILVGGSTRMPAVRSFAEQLFHIPPNLSQHPDEAVVIGALLQGAILEGNLKNVTLLDITPLSLGIETFGGLMNVIIPRNTTIPTKAGELFTNARAGQDKMKITLLQGERELARDNWKLGELEIAFIPANKGEARVGVQFSIDANGILHVLARDITSGTEKIIEVNHAIDVSDEAVEAMIADSLEHAFEDRDARLFTEARLQAEEMLPAVEKALQELNTLLDPQVVASLRAHIADVTDAIEQGELAPLKKRLQELDEATQSLATLLVEQAMASAQSSLS